MSDVTPIRKPGALGTEFQQKLSEFEHEYAHMFLPCRISPVAEQPVEWDVSGGYFGDVNIRTVMNSPMRFEATREAADRNDPGLLIDLIVVGTFDFVQDGRRCVVAGGDAVVAFTQMPFVSSGIDGTGTLGTTLLIPERTLGGVGDISRFGGLKLTAETPELQLLPGYIKGLEAGGDGADAQLKATIGKHLTDLVISAIARTMRKEDPTEGRGVRAARLAAIKRMIDENLAQPTLNAVRVARQLGVTERYVQMLMEESGTTFSAYLMEKRLQDARRSLALSLEKGVVIRDIAFASGFSDASHFTRAFRRRFGETPKAVRGGGAVEAAE